MEQVILEIISRHMKDKEEISSSYHKFTKASHTWQLDNHLQWNAHLVGEGRTANIFFLDFSKAFGTVSDNLLIDKLLKYGLGNQL